MLAGAADPGELLNAKGGEEGARGRHGLSGLEVGGGPGSTEIQGSFDSARCAAFRMTDCSAELAQVHGEEVAGEDAGADEGLVIASEASEDEVDCVVLAGVGEADELGDVAVGDADAVDGLGGVQRGMDI